VPITIPGGKPVTAEPGNTPTSPLSKEGPVLTTVDAPRTAKLPAVPRSFSAATKADKTLQAKLRVNFIVMKMNDNQ
jgi:hypothetical protein